MSDGMVGTKEARPSKHNRTDRQMDTQNVAACRGLHESTPDEIPDLKDVHLPPSTPHSEAMFN